MQNSDARDVVRRYLEAAFVRKNFEDIDDLVASAVLKNAAQASSPPSPTWRCGSSTRLASDDLVAVRVSASATHQGEFRGYRATGKPWQATASAWYQVSEGRIVNAWINWDWLSIMEQIGAVSWDDAAKDIGGSVRQHP